MGMAVRSHLRPVAFSDHTSPGKAHGWGENMAVEGRCSYTSIMDTFVIGWLSPGAFSEPQYTAAADQ